MVVDGNNLEIEAAEVVVAVAADEVAADVVVVVVEDNSKISALVVVAVVVDVVKEEDAVLVVSWRIIRLWLILTVAVEGADGEVSMPRDSFSSVGGKRWSFLSECWVLLALLVVLFCLRNESMAALSYYSSFYFKSPVSKLFL
jgi:hypothetical protein